MRIALHDLLAVRDPKVWRLSKELTDGLARFHVKVMEKGENRIFVAAPPEDRPVGMLMVRIIDNPNRDKQIRGQRDRVSRTRHLIPISLYPLSEW